MANRQEGTDLSALAERLGAGTPAVTVIGLGYVGLPVALGLVEAGCAVWGLDVDGGKVAALQQGVSYLKVVSDADVRAARGTGRFAATTDGAVLRESDAAFICVPTPFTAQKEPDTSHIAEAAREIAAHLHRGQLIVLRSTSYPGTTREVVQPILERTGLRVGMDFFLAFAPERIDPGNAQHTLRSVPVVVGGVDEVSGRLAARLLARIADTVVPVATAEAAEMTKLLENVFRNVNIALVNQVAQLCERMGLDVWEIIDAAATKPYGFMPFRPGLVGGHCIPVDPYYLAWKAREYDFHMDFIELAARVNEQMPYYVMDRFLAVLHQQRIGPGSVLILGVTFKKDVDDVRHSPALKVIRLAQQHGLEVRYHDPYIPSVDIDGQRWESVPLTAEVVHGADCVLILTDHSAVDYTDVVRNARLVFDVRNATRHVTTGREKIVRL